MLTCIIITGSLWMTDGTYVFSVDSVRKDPAHETVHVRPTSRSEYLQYSIGAQHQLRMGTEEYLTDCILSGYEVNSPAEIGGEAGQFVPWDDIDGEEQTGVTN